MNKRLLNIQELSQYIGVPVGTIYQWVSRRQIPFVKLGRSLKFDLNLIDGWILKNSIPPTKQSRLSREIDDFLKEIDAPLKPRPDCPPDWMKPGYPGKA